MPCFSKLPIIIIKVHVSFQIICLLCIFRTSCLFENFKSFSLVFKHFKNIFCLFNEFSLHFSVIVDELITRSWILFPFFSTHHKVFLLVFPSIRQYRLRFRVDRIIARHSTCKLEKFIPDICAMHTFAYWLADRYFHLKDVDARTS